MSDEKPKPKPKKKSRVPASKKKLKNKVQGDQRMKSQEKIEQKQTADRAKRYEQWFKDQLKDI